MATDNGANNLGKKKGGKDKLKEDPLNSKKREMASTNSTLYAILGGTRHSWMMNANAIAMPSHPSPKIRVGEGKRKQSLPSPPLVERTTATSKATTKNNSPNGSTSACAETVLPLPSPAPSEGQPSPRDMSTVDPNSPTGQTSATTADVASVSQSIPQHVSPLEVNGAFLPTHLVVPNLERPPTDLNEIESTRPPILALETESPIATKRRKIDATATALLPSSPSSRNAPNELLLPPHLNPMIPRTTTAPPPPPALSPQPRILIANSPQIMPAQVAIPGRQSQPPSPAALTPEPLSTLNLIEQLNIFINVVGGLHAFNPSERVRIDYVREAINLKDWSFLHLHQLYCLSNGKKEFEDKFKLSPQRLTGFQLLAELLSSNECVSGRFLRFFTHFPPLTNPPWYAPSVNTSINFLEHAQLFYHQLRRKCLMRRVTPTPEELHHMSLESQVIQRIVWRIIHNALNNGAENEYTAQAEKLFIQEQLAFRHALQQQKEREQYARILANEQAIKHIMPPAPFRMFQPAMGLPTMPTPQPNTHSLSSPTNIMPSHIVHEARRLRPASQMPQSHLVYQQLMRRQSIGLPLVSSPTHLAPQLPVPLVPSSPPHPALANTVHSPRPSDSFVPNIGMQTRFPAVAVTTQLANYANVARYPQSAPLTPAIPVPSSPCPSSPSTIARAPVDHFISVVGFAVTNFILRTEQPCAVRRFEVPQQYIQRLSKWQSHPGPTTHSKRMVHHGSLIYRLRSVRYNTGETDYENDNIWVLKPVAWPEHAFIEINDEPIALRRKNYFGKDFVADVTNQIKPGANELKVAYFGEANAGKISPIYALRMEILEAHAYPTMVSACLSQRLPKEQAVASIVARLKKIQDDEISVESQDLLLKIACPLSQKLIKEPVRGKSCRHADCFDLQTYLASRPRKKEREPPSPDAWHCPWCRGDARPRELIVDEFVEEILVAIRSMIAEGEIHEDDVKEVIVKYDGSWEVKREDISAMLKAKEAKRAESTPEVITIDD